MFSDDQEVKQKRSPRAHLSQPEISVDAAMPMGDRPKERRDMEALHPSLAMFADAEAAAKKDDLDSGEVAEIQRRLIGHFLREIDIQAPDRAEMALDEAFYDSLQWDEADARLLRERGQEPLVFNVISQSINWLIGSQKRARTDFRVLPRRKDASQSANTKTEIIKYLADVNKAVFSESAAFTEAVKAGLSWMECGIREDTDGEPIYERHESWRNLIMDSASRELDAGDSRFMFRMKWLDADHACRMFPARKAQIERAIDDWDAAAYGDSVFGDDAMDSVEMYRDVGGGRPDPHAPDIARRRVRMIEAWFKVPEPTDIMSGGDFAGEVFDPYSRGHIMDISTGRATVKRRLIFRTYVMVMTNRDALWFGASPYRHNRYPFTPLWGYRNSATGAPYGYIRNMRDPQRDINKRFAKALHIISSNKTVMEEGAVDDIDEFAEENARPDAIIVVKPNKRLELNVDRGLEATHLNLMQMSMSSIQTVSGITDEAMGRTTNAVSGKAINARQDQAALSSGMAFDNLRACKQYHGEKMLSLIEQFMPDQKEMRITNSRGDAKFVVVNDGLPENDIARAKADYIISEDAWAATTRQAQVAELFNVLSQLAPAAPQMVMVVLDLIIEGMDIPARDEIVKRIRQMTGMEDPNADPNVPDPEREAREQAKAMQQAMQERAANAELAKLEGEAAAAQAKAEKSVADAAKVIAGLPGDSLEAKRKALELAMAMLTSLPGAVPTADVLLGQVGMGDKPQGMPNAQMPPQQPQPMPGQQMPAQGIPQQ